MSSIIKSSVLTVALLLLYPATASADVKIIVNPPAYKYNSYGYKHYHPDNHTNKYNKHRYDKFRHNNQRYKTKKLNKYDFAPYSYRSKKHDYSYGRNKNYYSRDILRPSYSRIHNYNPYAHNYNKYQHQKEKAYWQGYKDGYNQHRKSNRLRK